ncbi:MAG TPA: TPM domain-containing protein [Holophagaceae bacterium]|nr:TPM domain-containing protein [Holophagaceae bacterium]
MPSHRALLRLVDAERVKTAITEAERLSSGEIRVSLSRFFFGDVHHAARRNFERLGMHRTHHRNGVLIFVVPSRRKVVVLGDEGIHGRVGQAFWGETAAAITARFKDDDYTGGLVAGIEALGRALAQHFPPEARNPDELPNEVDLA